MKKTLLLFSACLLTFGLQAQIRYGARLGLNVTNVNSKFDGEKIDTDPLVGFHLGAVAEFSFSEKVSILPSLTFSQFGAKLSQEIPLLGKVESTIRINYLMLGLPVGYKLDLDKVKIHLAAGPYASFGLSGKFKLKIDSETEEEDIKFGNNDDSDLRRGDFGLLLSPGIEFPVGNGALLINLNYGLGLANTEPKGDSDNSSKNTMFGLSVSYLFGGE
jgi:hypothetical protein